MWIGSFSSVCWDGVFEVWRNDFLGHTVAPRNWSFWAAPNAVFLYCRVCTFSFRPLLLHWQQNNILGIMLWISPCKSNIPLKIQIILELKHLVPLSFPGFRWSSISLVVTNHDFQFASHDSRISARTIGSNTARSFSSGVIDSVRGWHSVTPRNIESVSQ